MDGSQHTQSLDVLLGALSRDGRDFERLCKWFLENDPFWAAIFRRVWLWDDWPQRWGRDRGIDLIAETHDGRTFAVQSKNYGSRHTITKSDVDKFLSESNRPAIAERLLMASTDLLAAGALDVMHAQEKPVTTCLLEQLHRSELEWPASAEVLQPVSLSVAEPREHQLEALAAIEKWAAAEEPRGQVVMACGTGKSLVAVWSAEQVAARTVLVLVPTLALLRQTATVWARHARTKRRLLLVCSDTRQSEIEDLAHGDAIGNLRTTNPARIAESLSADEPLLVVCTYNSSPSVAKAMAALEKPFDLAIADEAHRCAGLESSSHKTILDDAAIPARRRLFFTATPTIYGTRDKGRAADKNVALASMDDRTRFGPVVHHLSFAAATARGLLCPYQVAVIPVSDDEVHQLIAKRRIVTADGDEHLDAASLATQIACARAMRRYGCKRMVAFQPSIPQSKRFSAQFPTAASLLQAAEAPTEPLWSAHVDGDDMRPAQRARILQRFGADEPVEHRLISNVKLLAEGVDFPGIDAVAFIDTRRGQASIIQAVGRAVRRAEGKTVGTIVLPVILRVGESFDAALARSEHRPVVDILGALRSHDPEIARSLDDLRFSYGPDGQRRRNAGRFVIDAPVHVGSEFADAVGLALTNALGVASTPSRRRNTTTAQPRVLEPIREPTEEEAFEIGLVELWSLGRVDLLPRVPESTRSFPLGTWWQEAKRRWLEGTLDEDTRWAIASSVSWLAPDLRRASAVRGGMAALTDAKLPEQVLAQLREGGVYTVGALAPLAEDPGQLDELLAPLSSIHQAVTHAAMSERQQLNNLLAALKILAATIAETQQDVDPDAWYWESRRLAVVDGFVHALVVAELERSERSAPAPPWRSETEPESYAAGVRAADQRVASRVRSLLPFKFPGDRATVDWCRYDQRDLRPDDQLDELGWEIYLLARARGGEHAFAIKQAMDGNLRERQRVRRDFLQRAAERGHRDPRTPVARHG